MISRESEFLGEVTSINFVISVSDLEVFDKIAKNERTSRSALLRKCVVDRIKEAKAC